MFEGGRFRLRKVITVDSHILNVGPVQTLGYFFSSVCWDLLWVILAIFPQIRFVSVNLQLKTLNMNYL